MIIIKTKNSSLVRLMLKVIAYIGFCVCSVAYASDKFTAIVPPVHEGGVSAVNMFHDADDQLNMLYQQKYSDRPSEFFYMTSNGEQWSSPILINKSSQNESTLNGVVRLNNGTPLLLMQADSTDYAKVFNINGIFQPPANPDDPIVPGLSDEQLGQLLADNQRLFYSLQIAGKWSTPFPISDTFRAVNPVMVAGDDGSALVVFSRDQDKNSATLNDFELYASSYKNNLWSKPVPLTDNNKAEYSVQIQYVGGAYLIVWVEDQDGNLDDRSDSKLYYAEVNANGTSKRTASSIVTASQNQPIPALGRIDDKAMLMWMSQAKSEDDPQRIIWQARYQNGWTAPVDSGLAGYKMSGAGFYTTAQGSAFVYRDDSLVRIALNDGVKWLDAGTKTNLNQSNIIYSDVNHFLDNQGSLHIGIAGHVLAAGEDAENADAGDGLYYLSKSLSHDLTIIDISSSPYAKYIGEEVVVNFKVRNNGASPAQQYSVEIHSGGNLLKKFEEGALGISAQRDFQYKFNLQQVDTQLEVKVISSGDSSDDNNLITFPVKVKPDYAVRSVVRKDATHIEVDIIERKGIAAASVKVDAYLVDGATKTKLTSGDFNPGNGFPMLIETTALIDKSTPYQILINVNSDRGIAEDNYSNNQGAYNHIVLPDFRISQFYITAEHIYVSVSNKGNLPAGSVSLLLTDNPLLARQGVVGPVWYQNTVNLDDSGEAKLVLNRADYPALNGDNLYVVVNPDNAIRESDHNNNSGKVSLKSTTAQGGVGGDPQSYPQANLVLEKAHAWCDNVQVIVRNQGDTYAVAPIVKLATADNYVVATTSLPVLLVNTSETVTFNDITPGDYVVKISHVANDGQQESVAGNVSVVVDESCLLATNNDISVEEVSIAPATSTGDVVVSVLVSTKGYKTNYLKPLVRFPLQLEIKQGIQVLYSDTSVHYLQVNDNGAPHLIRFNLSKSVFPDANVNLNVKIQARDDEASMANNVYNIVVNGKEL